MANRKRFSVYHFSLSLAKADKDKSVPKLLRHLAKTLESEFPNVEVQDIVFHPTDDFDDYDEYWPHVTVYYHLKD